MKKITFLLLVFIGLSSLQVNAQINGTFNATVNSNWSNADNWTDNIIADATGTATLTASVDIDAATAVGALIITNPLTVGSVSNFTLTLNGPDSGNNTIENNSTDLVTFDCDISFAVSGKRVFNAQNTTNSTVFATGNTIALGANSLLMDNDSPLAFQMNGVVTGSGVINIVNAAGAGRGGLTLGAASDLSGFTGGFNTRHSPVVFNNTTAIASGNNLQVQGTGSYESTVLNNLSDANIIKNATSTGTSLVTFTTNQTNLGALTVDTRDLSMDFDSSTSVVFSGYTTSGTEGVVDLLNYTDGELRIGTTSTSVPSSVLDTWTVDGAAATLDQDASGNIIFGVACTEATDVTSLAVSAETTTTIDLSWVSADCFDEVLVVAKSGSAVTAGPTGDGTTPAYTANAAFGTAGTDANLVANEFAVYKGTGNTVSVTGLTINTDYHFEVFTRKGSDWSDGAVINEIPNTFTTDTAGAWETATNWVGDVAPTTATDNVSIGHTMTITSDVTVNELTIVSGSVTAEPGFSITINGDRDTNHQLFANSTATAFGSLMLNGSGTHAAGYNLYVASNASGNQLISSPFVETLDKMMSVDTGDGTDQIFNNTAGGDATQLLFGTFDNENGAFLTSDSDNNFTTTLGTGYRAATISGSKIQFKAVPGTIANVDVAITHGAHATYGQWNLIGNPYPTFLNFQDFFTANTAQFEASVNNAIYMWNGSSYTAYNNLNTTTTSLISPGKGFFVKTIASTPGTVTFTPAMRKISSDGTLVSKSANNNEKALVKINLTTATKTFATEIYFVQNQTRGLDVGYDAGAFAGSTDGIFTNLVEANTGEGLLIQALPYEDYNNVVVPVAINAEAGAELTISLDIASLTLPENTYVYLKDNVLNTTTLLNDVDYVFTPDNALSGTGRFFLEFSAKSVLNTDEFAVNEMLIYTNQATKSIIIKGLLKTDASAKVFDIQGRMVLEQKIESSNISNVINANSLNTGVYMVQLENKIQKVIIK